MQCQNTASARWWFGSAQQKCVVICGMVLIDGLGRFLAGTSGLFFLFGACFSGLIPGFTTIVGWYFAIVSSLEALQAPDNCKSFIRVLRTTRI